MNGKFFLPHFQIQIRKKSEQDSGGRIPGMVLRIVVTRKIRRAVDRNRIKRALREFFRAKRALLRGNLVICRVDPSAVKIKNAHIFQELGKVL